jgi:hypothetical protein
MLQPPCFEQIIAGAVPLFETEYQKNANSLFLFVLISREHGIQKNRKTGGV